MITKGERQQIKAMLQDSKWQTIERVVNLYCEKTSGESVVKDSEWETIKVALVNDGKVIGVRSFIQELYQLANQLE